MADIRRGQILRDDLALFDGVTRTASRVDATGGTVTGLNIGDEVDLLQVFGDGTNRTPGTITAAIGRLGGGDATFKFATGTWAIDSDVTIPATIACHIPRGCVFEVSNGVTLTFSGFVYAESAHSEFATGDGTVTITADALIDGRVWVARTQAEIDAGVEPTDRRFLAEPHYDARRLGWSPSASASVNSAAIRNALLVSPDVVLTYESGTESFDVDESFTLGLWGQRLRGVRIGEAVSQADVGIVLNVVSGFPTTGGDSAQSVIVLTDRYQSIQNISIDCNSIALHGVYGTGSDVSHGNHENILIQGPSGDGWLFADDTWMNRLDHVRVSNAGGWGFNWDSTGAGGHTTTRLCNCYVTSATTGAFRFDRAPAMVMSGCAADQNAGYMIQLEGAQVVLEGGYAENTVQLFNLTEITDSLVVKGGRFSDYGDDASPPSTVIANAGHLVVQGAYFLNAEAATVFATFSNGSNAIWEGNFDGTGSFDLFDQDLTIGATARIRADNAFQQSGASSATQRFIVRGTTPGLTLYETDRTGNEFHIHLQVAAGVFSMREVNDSFSTQSIPLQYDTDGNQWILSGLVNYADDSAAASGGVPVGGLYRNGSVIQIRVA